MATRSGFSQPHGRRHQQLQRHQKPPAVWLEFVRPIPARAATTIRPARMVLALHVDGLLIMRLPLANFATVLDQFRQAAPDLAQFVASPVQVLDLFKRDHLDGGAGPSLVLPQVEQLADLLDGETQMARSLHEAQRWMSLPS